MTKDDDSKAFVDSKLPGYNGRFSGRRHGDISRCSWPITVVGTISHRSAGHVMTQMIHSDKWSATLIQNVGLVTASQSVSPRSSPQRASQRQVDYGCSEPVEQIEN
ncbi:hypothetical protein G9P44_001726 [Scheffersomyces stipitis]|nr:hypothetical protein G9P44_001726 [Scheffersomyces stipitis]